MPASVYHTKKIYCTHHTYCAYVRSISMGVSYREYVLCVCAQYRYGWFEHTIELSLSLQKKEYPWYPPGDSSDILLWDPFGPHKPYRDFRQYETGS